MENKNVLVAAPLAGLLKTLQKKDEWTQEERDKFIAIFEAVLDFCILTKNDKV